MPSGNTIRQLTRLRPPNLIQAAPNVASRATPRYRCRITFGPRIQNARRVTQSVEVVVDRTLYWRRQQMSAQEAKVLRATPIATPTDLKPNAIRDLAGALNILLADMFALYLKTKNFHWHVSGPHFRDYHLLLDEHGEKIFATTDAIAERVRKTGSETIRSIGHIGRLRRVLDNDADFVTPADMLAELRDDNRQLIANLRETHGLCDEHGDVATASLLETWIDEAERRTWFLFEAGRGGVAAED